MLSSPSPLDLARLILCCSLILAGCGGQAPREEIGEGDSSSSAPVMVDDTSFVFVGMPEWSRVGETWFGDYDEMAERRIIRAAVVRSRTLFFLDGGQPQGLTYEALTRFETFINEELGTGLLKVHVVIVPLTREQLLPALLDGQVDISAANLTVTQDRMEQVNFGAPLLSDVSELLVTRAEGPVPKSVEELSGMEIHVRRSSSYFQSLQRLNERFLREARPPILIVEADELLETEDLLELLNAGVIPATVVDKHLADFWVQVFENIRVHPDIRLREGGSIAWAIRKDSPELTAVLERFARGHRAGTLLGNMALRRYLKSADYIVNPGGQGEQQKLEAALPHFETFAPLYGFDPLLLIAQAFQESRLDQSLVSPVGAVGVMQLMPTTAADPNVGFDDITELENNVHAGTKYLRFLLDQYFQDGSLDPLNEHLFAFAAYNAGPARVARLRAEAAEMGLDPNLWFRNVEHVAANRIGRETVQYVSNVYKYYLAYRQMEALERLRRKPSG